MNDDESRACLLTWPDDDDALLDWFREGHADLVKTLESVPDDTVAFTFLPAPSARAFWARRQAHETAIHRADAESASGAITAYDPSFAADGIDEIVRGFASRAGRVTADPARRCSSRATDTDRSWLLSMGPDGLSVSDGGDAECTVSGTASDLYLLLWNRRASVGLEVSGDPGVLDLWRETHQIRWTGRTRKAVVTGAARSQPSTRMRGQCLSRSSTSHGPHRRGPEVRRGVPRGHRGQAHRAPRHPGQGPRQAEPLPQPRLL